MQVLNAFLELILCASSLSISGDRLLSSCSEQVQIECIIYEQKTHHMAEVSSLGADDFLQKISFKFTGLCHGMGLFIPLLRVAIAGRNGNVDGFWCPGRDNLLSLYGGHIEYQHVAKDLPLESRNEIHETYGIQNVFHSFQMDQESSNQYQLNIIL